MVALGKSEAGIWAQLGLAPVPKAQPIFVPSGTLLSASRIIQETANGRICVFPSNLSGEPSILVQHELRIIPNKGKQDRFRLEGAPRLFHGTEEERRSFFECFRSAVLQETATGRTDALGALEWRYDDEARALYILAAATAGNGESRRNCALAMLFKGAERIAGIKGAGRIMLHSETITPEKLKAMGYHLVPGNPGITPEYIKGLFPGDLA